ncbi:MAG TPA: organic solvent ABC transporter permease, partial [Marinobacter sp.]|nr:organic solvent ABC transporter permease [Marinobacter sp.]
LSPVEISHPASDTSIKTIKIRKIGGSPQLAGLEAISTRPTDVVMHATNKQSAEVEYFVDGDPGGESEIRISLHPSSTYRWVQKTLRVRIDPID